MHDPKYFGASTWHGGATAVSRLGFLHVEGSSAHWGHLRASLGFRTWDRPCVFVFELCSTFLARPHPHPHPIACDRYVSAEMQCLSKRFNNRNGQKSKAMGESQWGFFWQKRVCLAILQFLLRTRLSGGSIFPLIKYSSGCSFVSPALRGLPGLPLLLSPFISSIAVAPR